MSADTIDQIFQSFARFGSDSYGERIDQLQHALQAAALARADGASDALIAAALLHDVGQFVDDAGHAAERHGTDARHEILGARQLACTFPPSVSEPVRLHVDAKRYLCAIEPEYGAALSAASQLSLRVQGGPMTAGEAQAFEREPYFADAVRLRRYDDQGKFPEWLVPDLESYRGLLARLLIEAPADRD